MNEAKCRRLVYERSEGRCEMTGVGGNHSYHHRLKRSQGGRWTPENVVLVSGSGTTGAHGWIENNPNAAEALGFHVRPWQSPKEIPVKTFLSGWVYLLANGQVRRREEDAVAAAGGGLSDGLSVQGGGEVEGVASSDPEVPA